LASREAPGSTFASLMVEEPLKERPARLARLEIAIGDIVVRTDATIDAEQLSRVIRAVRASQGSLLARS
jgi:transposase